MGSIQVLDDSIVALISAGEVIENPSSIVKELVENALDAKATHVDIVIEEGGISKIIVSDNGSGILREDCPICILRHSTSKIRKKEDIDAITSYGFRGEALASIASVANLTIETCSGEEELGTKLISRIGESPSITDISRPSGTTITVTDLFAQVPARLKHLNRPSKEGQRILEVVMRHAAVCHDVGFRFIRDDKIIIDCPSNQNHIDRMYCLFGADIAENLLPLQSTQGKIAINGFIARPPFSRGNRSREYFSILKRPIQSNHLSQAIENGYSTLLMRGR